MFKVQLLASLIAVLWISVVICNDCLFKDEFWHADDASPRKFNYCDNRKNQTAVGDCPVGTGFVKNETASGCIPWSDWDDKCITKTVAVNVTCNGNNFKRLQPSMDPEYFFLCTGQNGTAVSLKCPNGTAFYAQNKYLGCFQWSMWRNLTGCLI